MATVPSLLEDLLLGPNHMAALVIPHARRRVRGLDAPILRLGGLHARAQREPLDGEPDLGADGCGSALADGSARHLGDGAGVGAGAVLVAGGALPGEHLGLRSDDEVVPPALADPGKFVGVCDAVRSCVCALAVSVWAGVVDALVVAGFHGILSSKEPRVGDWVGLDDAHEDTQQGDGGDVHD